MELLEGVIAEDLFIFIPEYGTVILSDIHIGYEESLNRQGILVPRTMYTDLLLRLEKFLGKLKKKHVIQKIVINGDLLHEFGKISKKDKELTSKFVQFLLSYGDVVIIEGNHDKALKFFAGKEVKIVHELLIGRFLVMHGDVLPSKDSLKKSKVIIIGHEHPSVSLASGSRVERYKCFLKGTYNRKDLIVMPSCNLFIEGTDVLKEKTLSPFLKDAHLMNFHVFVIGDNLYDFGKLKNLLESN